MTTFWLAVLAWLAPLYPFFIIAGMAVAVDTYFGFKLSRIEKKTSSRKFARVLWKFLLYNLIILSAYVVDVYLIGVFIDSQSHVELTLTRAITFGVLVVELVSVDEKKRQINGKGFRYYWDKVMNVLRFLNDERKKINE